MIGGDSGAPVYAVRSDKKARAAGLASWGITEMCFTSIAQAEQRLLATVLEAGQGQ